MSKSCHQVSLLNTLDFLMEYDILSSNITIFFASHRKSVHKPKIRPIVNPSIAPKNGLLISKGFRNLRTDILPVSQFLG